MEETLPFKPEMTSPALWLLYDKYGINYPYKGVAKAMKKVFLLGMLAVILASCAAPLAGTPPDDHFAVIYKTPT